MNLPIFSSRTTLWHNYWLAAVRLISNTTTTSINGSNYSHLVNRSYRGSVQLISNHCRFTLFSLDFLLLHASKRGNTPESIMSHTLKRPLDNIRSLFDSFTYPNRQLANAFDVIGTSHIHLVSGTSLNRTSNIRHVLQVTCPVGWWILTYLSCLCRCLWKWYHNESTTRVIPQQPYH